jgi:NADH-quinone oxidoreductase subunit K
MVPLQGVLLLGGALFCIGLYGVLARRHAVLILLGIELMLNAVGLDLVAFAAYAPEDKALGQIVTLFVIAIAAAEVGLALAIILRLYRQRTTVNVDEADLMRG